jgi:hypothetical protein
MTVQITLELEILAASVVLGLVHIVAASHSASLQRSYRWTASARKLLLTLSPTISALVSTAGATALILS